MSTGSIKKEVKTISEIKSNIFSDVKEFNKEYKLIKESFISQLGYNKFPQGTIILYSNYGGCNFIPITSSTKKDMEDWIKRHLDNKHYLLIKEQSYLIKSK